jgi:hypothetical protein
MMNYQNPEVAGYVQDLYRIIKVHKFRKTEKVTFETITPDGIGHISSIDKVIHGAGAFSPGSIGTITRPWYMHPAQEDNLIVLQGIRHVQLYSRKHGKIETFSVYPDRILKDGSLFYDGACVFSWPCEVFHRVISCEKEGSISLNFAVHTPGFDINTCFNIYDLNPETGEYAVIREGYKDQLPA